MLRVTCHGGLLRCAGSGTKRWRHRTRAPNIILHCLHTKRLHLSLLVSLCNPAPKRRTACKRVKRNKKYWERDGAR
jgi:hypothetical protein